MIPFKRHKSILEKKIISKYFFYYFFIIFIVQIPVFAQNNSSIKKVAVFALSGNSAADNALTIESAEVIKKVFNDCGRFMPAEKNPDSLYKEATKDGKEDEKNIYEKIAILLNTDLYILVSVKQYGNRQYSEVEIIAINRVYKNLEKKINLQSKINSNIPVKIGREIALMHEKIPLSTDIIPYGNNCLIRAGEWHGIKNNTRINSSIGIVEVIQSGRFESIVKIRGKLKEERQIILNIYPDIHKIVHGFDDDISRNTVARYNLDINSPEKRLLEGICCINMCGNVCLPGYGAFLSTSYLGFKDPKPNWPGLATSTGAISMQLFLPELLTGFKI